MKIALLVSLVGSAAAFAPASQQQRSVSAIAATGPFSNEIGAQAPLGYLDPLGLCADGDKANFDRLRWAELKHGRVAMLAVVGYLTTYAGIRFPGAEDIPAGFAALPAVPGMVWAQMIATWALMEAANRDQVDTPEVASGWKADFIGDFRNGKIDFGELFCLLGFCLWGTRFFVASYGL
jgi:Chlorophyll A-B binding protein